MKILSKYKDYYDYLTGIYGIDEKLVLDRRDNESISLATGKVTFYIGDYIIEGLTDGKNFIYGEKLSKFIHEEKYPRFLLSTHFNRNYSESYRIKYKDEYFWCYLKPIKDNKLTNTNNNCPILIETPYGLKKYPILKDYNMVSILDPEVIYKILTEWLSNQITLREKNSELSNTNKIESKGFDKKRSFRPKMK